MNARTYKRIHESLRILDTFIILSEKTDQEDWLEVIRRVRKLPNFMALVNKELHSKISELKAFVKRDYPISFEEWQTAKRKIGDLRDFSFECYIENNAQNTHRNARVAP